MKPRHFSDPDVARAAGAKASRHTPARTALMARLADLNRGRKVPDDPRRESTLAAVRATLAGGEVTAANWAAWAGVSPRTLRRWLAGQTWPDSERIDRMQARLDELNETK